MCGRFTQMYTWKELVELYRLTLDRPASNLRPRYSMCPTTTIDTVRLVDGEHVFEPMRWGLIPGWWKKPLKEMKVATFNARGETVREKPMFRSAFKKSRCLIPASGYYEWQTTPQGKQPFYFTPKDGGLLTMAGLWEEWNDKEAGATVRSCTMLITEPNAFVASVHDRMPVLLEPSQFEQWEKGTDEEAAELIKPVHEEFLQKWAVSTRVNSSRTSTDDHTLIEQVDTAA